MKNERGFMLLSAIFLTLIVSLMAQMILTANVKVQQRNSALYFTAINLANEQFALLESSSGIEIPAEDLKSFNGVKENSVPVEFRVFTESKGNSTFTVKIEWTVGGETKTFESTKIVRSITENPN